ncbi:MAG: metalloprotease TldD [Methylococcales bacterium]|nr:metalloprotease TldD [Methylococcales bacterium]MBT7411331.1 metalloprotease TldD [Methylococcales bacterium]
MINTTARDIILEPAQISDAQLEKVLGIIQGTSVDAADVYFQSSRYESWSLDDGIIKEGSYSIDRGVGVRVISGEKTGFAYADDIILDNILDSAKTARNIVKCGQTASHKITHSPIIQSCYHPIEPFAGINTERKIDLLKRVDVEARKTDARIKQVMAHIIGVHEVILILDSEGKIFTDIRPLIRFGISVIAEDKNGREQGSSGGGGRYSFETLLENNRIESFTQEAVRQALVNLGSKPAPAGNMTVVLGSGWPGVLLHEAIGHGLEGDFNRKQTSAFSGRLGEKVASELCTVVDNGTLANRRGSLNIDDEGTPTQSTVLIENGILKGYMQDKHNARLMGVKSTGNGRRESYAHLPLPRMTNTYMEAGQHDPNEIIASVEKGLYAVNFGGGQVDITSGKFVFSASEAYLIEKGKVTTPVKGATLIGNGPDALTKVSMVGNDLELDTGIGVCGKDGQSVPVGVGQPTLKIDGMTVGGTDIEGME